MIKAVLFDVDGVLVDSLTANRKFVNDLLKEQGKKELNEKEFFAIRFMTIKQVIETFCPELKEKEINRIRKKWSYEYKNYLKLTVLNNGAKEILKELKEKVKLGIITNRSKTSVLMHHKIINFFDSIITSSDVKNPKPSPEGILKALKELKIKPEEAIFIGDAETDIKAGNSAGVKTLSYKIKLDDKTKKINSFKEIKKFFGD